MYSKRTPLPKHLAQCYTFLSHIECLTQNARATSLKHRPAVIPTITVGCDICYVTTITHDLC